MGKFPADSGGRAEQNTGIRLGQHGYIVIGIARRDDCEIEFMQGLHGAALGIGDELADAETLLERFTGYPLVKRLQTGLKR